MVDNPVVKYHAERLRRAIDLWVEHSIRIGESVPDFWDELDTSTRLAEFLAGNGFWKAEKKLAEILNGR